jgi:hypothetical protein
MNKINWNLIIILSLILVPALNAASGVIKSGDIIKVWVKGEPELSVKRQVGTDGSIVYPLIGRVGVNNLKTIDAAKLIAQMLEDGYLRSPLVQISIEKNARSSSSPVKAASLNTKSAPSQNIVETKPELIELTDKQTGKGVGGAAMMLGNRIYQSNRLGQVLVDSNQGRLILIADGYKTLTGEFSRILKSGNPGKIYLDPVTYPDEIVFTVVDGYSRRPVANVDVKLENMKVSTNREGVFKIKKLQKEFGELLLTKRGYKSHRMVIDFKGPQQQQILMMRDD